MLIAQASGEDQLGVSDGAELGYIPLPIKDLVHCTSSPRVRTKQGLQRVEGTRLSHSACTLVKLHWKP